MVDGSENQCDRFSACFGKMYLPRHNPGYEDGEGWFNMLRTHLGFDNYAVLAKYQQENTPLISIFIRHGLGIFAWVILVNLLVCLNSFNSGGCFACAGGGVGAAFVAFGLASGCFFSGVFLEGDEHKCE